MMPGQAPGQLGRERAGKLVQAQLCVEADAAGQERLSAASRRWFERGAPILGGDLWRELQARPVPPADVEYRWDGHSGDVWAESAVDYGRMGPPEWQCYGESAWDDLLKGAAGPSIVLNLTIYRLAELVADLLYPGFPRLSLSARYIDLRSYRWWGFKVQGTEDLLLGTPDRQETLLEFVRETAELRGVTYGEISFDNASHIDFSTSFEHNLDLYPWQTVAASKRTLRGYGWLTVVPPGVGSALGGVEGLRASGAFAQVDQLSNGTYWLLATRRFEHYDMPHAERVQQVLAPALPAGRPRPDRPYESPHLLALGDARPSKRAPKIDREEIFKNRIDPRYGSGHRTALAVRASTLHTRYPTALIWAAIDEDGPHLICWGAATDQVFVWQFMPEDDAYAGLDIITAAGTGLDEVASDPLSQGMQVTLGPPFEQLGLPRTESAGDPLAAAAVVTVFDAIPGLQIYHTDQGDQQTNRTAMQGDLRLLGSLREAVIASRGSVGTSPAAKTPPDGDVEGA